MLFRLSDISHFYEKHECVAINSSIPEHASKFKKVVGYIVCKQLTD